MIIISSKKEGFRRCGVAHSTTEAKYPDDKFSDKVLVALKAEPMLDVEHIDNPLIAETSALSDMTVAVLKELLDKLTVPYDSRATKAALIGLIEANTAEPPK